MDQDDILDFELKEFIKVEVFLHSGLNLYWFLDCAYFDPKWNKMLKNNTF